MASVRKRKWKGAAGRKVGGRPAGECWEVSWNDGEKRRRKSGFVTKAEAEAFAVERQKEVNDGVSRPAGHRMTVADLVDEFLDQTRTRLERRVIGPGHFNNIEADLRNYIARAPDYRPKARGNRAAASFTGSLSAFQLSRLRPSTIEKFRDDLLATGLSADAVRKIIVTLHQALDYARRRDYIPTNPAARIKIEKPREEKNERVTPPSTSLVKTVISAATGPVKLAIELSACTGIRAGELRALRYRHINFEKRALTIKVALNVDNEEGPPKSLAGDREIPLAPVLVEKIAKHRDDAVERGGSALVFPPEPGWKFIPKGWLRYRLKAVLAELGLVDARDCSDDVPDEEGIDDDRPGMFTWHSLRHYAISSWIAQGLGLKAVQTFAGHADVATTWNRYGHLFPDEEHWDKIAAAATLTLTSD